MEAEAQGRLVEATRSLAEHTVATSLLVLATLERMAAKDLVTVYGASVLRAELTQLHYLAQRAALALPEEPHVDAAERAEDERAERALTQLEDARLAEEAL